MPTAFVSIQQVKLPIIIKYLTLWGKLFNNNYIFKFNLQNYRLSC